MSTIVQVSGNGNELDALNSLNNRRTNLVQNSSTTVGALYAGQCLQSFRRNLMLTGKASVDHTKAPVGAT